MILHSGGEVQVLYCTKNSDKVASLRLVHQKRWLTLTAESYYAQRKSMAVCERGISKIRRSRAKSAAYLHANANFLVPELLNGSR